MARHAPMIVLNETDREVLGHWLRSPTTPQRLVLRARIVLAATEGLTNEQIGARWNCSRQTAGLWRSRYVEGGLDGLADAPGRGRPPEITEAKIAEIVAATLQLPPGETHWSARRLAKVVGVNHMAVHRIWKAHRLAPHRTETFKFSNDPQLVPKVVDVVGLYLNPPKKALVLSVDVKSQIQAIERTQPLLPIRPGLPARYTHDYTRHGTTDLYAALNVATGEVLARCYPRHRHQEFLDFLKLIHRRFPRREVHLILDNASTHLEASVKEWFAKHKRFHVHFTPTGSSWLNQVETWFGILGNRALRRGSFASVAALIAAITRFLDIWKQEAAPFAWTKTADDILTKAVRNV
jgi:transposase